MAYLRRISAIMAAIAAGATTLALAPVAGATNGPGALDCPTLSVYNNAHYQIQTGQTATCTIDGASDVPTGSSSVDVFVKYWNSTHTTIDGSVSGTGSSTTITFTYTAPSVADGGCSTSIVAYGALGTNASNAILVTMNGSQPAGFAFVDASGNLLSCPTDTTPPTCKLLNTLVGPPKSIEVGVQDTGSGLQSIVTSTQNATASAPSFSPGTTSAVDVTATKVDQTKGATLVLTVTDEAGNKEVCDPIFGGSVPLRTATVRAGGRIVIPGLAAQRAHLILKAGSGARGSAIVAINGRRFAILRLGRSRSVRLDLAAALSAGHTHTP